MPRGNGSRSRKRQAPALDVVKTSTSRKLKRPITDAEISGNLATESDDNYSNFDDDIADPDFVLESRHNTDSEQSEGDEDYDAILQPEEIQQAIERETNTEQELTEEQEASREQVIEEQIVVEEVSNEQVREEQIAVEEVSNEQVREEQIDDVVASNVVREEPAQQAIEDSISERLRYYYGRNRHKWSSVEPSRLSRVRQHNIVEVPHQVPPVFSSFEELWKLLVTENMLEIIVRHTNEKLNIYRARFKDTSRSELNPMNDIELKALIGLLFFTSVFRSSHENAEFIFATDGTGREIFRCVMSKNRFLVLINCLRFDDSQTRPVRLRDDKLAAISELFNAFIDNCQQNYILGTHACIDEMLVGFRGRCSFIIYMPSKPNKYGLKILMLVDAHTFYVYNAYIYHGRGSDGAGLTDAEKRFSIPTQSVIRLSKGIEGSNRNITADNWFSSIELLQALKDRGLTYLGTLKKNKKEIPPEFQASRERAVHTMLYGFTKDFTIVSYVPKPIKAVILVSSMHHRKETDTATNKPVMIVDYNKTKGGVDEVDKKCSNYTCSRRTRRWPMALFYRLIDLSGVNAYVLYNKCQNKEAITRGSFLLSLARQLVLPEMKLRVYNDRIPRELRATIERVIGSADMPTPPPPTDHSNSDPGIRKTCAICPSRLKRRTKYACCHCRKPMCLTCCLQICKDCKLRQA